MKTNRILIWVWPWLLGILLSRLLSLLFAPTVNTVNGQITMTTANNAEIIIGITGSGTASVDWGDSTTQDYTLENYITGISHHYATAAIYTITIIGDDMTYLDCSNNQLTSLNVRGCIALTELDYSNNPI